MSVTIRRATATDAERLGLIAAATFGFACPPDQTAAGITDFITMHLSPQRFTEYLSNPDRALFLAENAGVPVGYTMLVFGETADPDVRTAVHSTTRCELSKFYVFSGLHGRGLAGELMDATLAEVRRRGSAGVWLGVNQQNERANRFYEKHGFAVVGTKRFLVGDRLENDYVRELLLAA